MLFLISAAGLAMDADDAPETIDIDILSELYGPVSFDHAAHTEITQCSHCHHHTTGTGPANPSCGRCHERAEEGDTVACSDCHAAKPFTRENLRKMEDPELIHIDKPGLKAAYHLNCRGCHEETDGPTGCRDCHAMTEAGEKRFNTGRYAPAGYKVGAGHQQ
jgi:hypothetical protein